ncbi:TRAP transporter substrate-binding protein [Desulfatitalea tepidiphila]|uniref:TRAP transporter substrate-binding protein n=1 Tax=Desulfatitalea tepidiphila TaxID=1185843 RepID=UPI0006B53F2A|nr:TRAP transporter substrate-binding protein [Desulfatitalea tepidiphila]
MKTRRMVWACLAFWLASTAWVSTGTAAETLRFATGFSPMHTMQVKVFEPWAKKISEMTGGRIEVKMFPAGALGKPATLYELAEKGIADIAYTLHDYTPGRFPMTEVFALPYMTPSAEKTAAAMWNTYEQSADFRKEYSQVKLLALFCHPGGDFHTTKRPIRSLDDLKGLKIRTASPFVTQALKIYGAIPIAMPITEAYSALERGVVDGTVAPWEGLGVFKLDDLTRFALEIDFYTMTMMVVMNQRKYDALPADIRKAIDETTGLTMSLAAGKAYDETDEPFKSRALEKGIQINTLSDEEMRRLKGLTQPLRKEWVEKGTAKNLDAQAVLQTALRLLEMK